MAYKMLFEGRGEMQAMRGYEGGLGKQAEAGRPYRDEDDPRTLGREDRRSEMERAMSEQSDAIASLAETVSKLADRLDPVLTPVGPGKDGPSCTAVCGYGSPLARALDQHTDGLRSLRERVQTLLHRLEV